MGELNTEPHSHQAEVRESADVHLISMPAPCLRQALTRFLTPVGLAASVAYLNTGQVVPFRSADSPKDK